MGYKFLKPLRDKTCQIDYGHMCIGTDCETKSTFTYRGVTGVGSNPAGDKFSFLNFHSLPGQNSSVESM